MYTKPEGGRVIIAGTSRAAEIHNDELVLCTLSFVLCSYR